MPPLHRECGSSLIYLPMDINPDHIAPYSCMHVRGNELLSDNISLIAILENIYYNTVLPPCMQNFEKKDLFREIWCGRS